LEKYEPRLKAITVCAEAYRYNFLIDCASYSHDVEVLNTLLDDLLVFMNGE
jgi:hypothetical protein